MRKMYFLMDSSNDARRVMNELLLNKIPEQQINVLTHVGELPDDLPEATPDETSDFWPALLKGGGLGILTGLLIGVLLAMISLSGYPLLNITFNTLANTPLLALLAVFGGLMGAFGAAIVGISAPNTMLKRFDRALDKGRVLLMVNVPQQRVEEIRRDIQQTEPRAEYCGVEPMKPAFP